MEQAPPSEETIEVPSGPTILFLGDSLSAGLGLAEELAFPALVEARLHDSGIPVRVVNAGVSGDTTAGGLRRLDWLLKQEPYGVVVELGANDGLRGLPLSEIEGNLRRILERLSQVEVKVVLVGMKMPPNYGEEYSRGFEAIFPRLASEFEVTFVPFLLEGVAGHPDLNQADGIHPTAEGHKRLADNVEAAIREA
ncbi:MAG: arylesterase, partial [Thermoanaerobaculia bacterium]|nr:arylesterase [Thermoanaerobaculia bacterium]